MYYTTLLSMGNNMKLLAKIAYRFNLIALIFQNFPVRACPPEGVHFAHCFCSYPQVIFFIGIAFSGPPLIFFCLATLMLKAVTDIRRRVYNSSEGLSISNNTD